MEIGVEGVGEVGEDGDNLLRSRNDRTAWVSCDDNLMADICFADFE